MPEISLLTVEAPNGVEACGPTTWRTAVL